MGQEELSQVSQQMLDMVFYSFKLDMVTISYNVKGIYSKYSFMIVLPSSFAEPLTTAFEQPDKYYQCL